MVTIDIIHDVMPDHHEFCGITTAVGYAVTGDHMVKDDIAYVIDDKGAVYRFERIA